MTNDRIYGSIHRPQVVTSLRVFAFRPWNPWPVHFRLPATCYMAGKQETHILSAVCFYREAESEVESRR